jgi:non-specific serine/threonine protein kinase
MTSPPSPGTPVHLGEFEIERELGRGGMGVVYLARDPRLERRVALKTLTEDLALDPTRLEQVRREAKLLASLNHPNIAVIHGMEEDERGSRFLVLEWVNGITLAERMQSNRLSLDEAMRVVAQIAEALGAAHQAGVVHRDLKPRNVMVLDELRVKVLDFGLARQTGARRAESIDGKTWIDSGISGIDGSHVIFGTAGYLSPERVLGESEDARTDVFSFGCVVFECLAGRPAFHGASVLEVLTRVVWSEPDWSALPSDTPAELRALLASCLEKRPDARPAGMQDLVRTIERVRGRRDRVPEEPPAGRAPHNLPRFLTSFVGRDLETAECLRLLARTRLLSLIGPGGSGKTRLAVRIAELALDRDWQGVWFAGLAAVQDPDRVADATATALGVAVGPGKPPETALLEWLGEKRAIVILDNCEHVLDPACALALRMLERCPRVIVMVTSRQELGVPGEQIFAVPTMSVPARRAAPDLASAARYESIRLFQERAWMADRGFTIDAANIEDVAEICRRVDGIPLAIELAAARVRVLAPAEIARRLDRQLRLLEVEAGSGDPRHRALRSTIQWSFDLLDPGEQKAFLALAVFAGGWTLESAAKVLGSGDDFEVLDLMSRLVSRSLVVAEHPKDQSSRFRFLEPVRQYALESLGGSGIEEEARDRHLDFFLDLARRAEEGMSGPEQPRWVEQIELEHENLLGALERCARSEARADRAQDLAASLVKFWYVHGHVTIGRAALKRALETPGGARPTRARARALYGAGVLAAFSNDGQERSEPLFAEALEIARAIDEKWMAARSLNALAAVASRRGEHDRAVSMLEESRAFFRQTDDRHGQAMTVANLAAVAWRGDDSTKARAFFEEARVLLREVGELTNLAQACIGLTFVLVRRGEIEAAPGVLAEAIEILRRLGARSTNVAGALLAAGELATARDRFDEAARLFGAADVLLAEIGLTLDATDVWWRDHQRCVARIGAGLGDEAYARLSSEGRALSWDDALPIASRVAATERNQEDR